MLKQRRIPWTNNKYHLSPSFIIMSNQNKGSSSSLKETTTTKRVSIIYSSETTKKSSNKLSASAASTTNNSMMYSPQKANGTTTTFTTTKVMMNEVGAVAKKSALLAGKGVGFLTNNGQLRHATPVAPHSDVFELEYISSLHQCTNMQALRQDGSVSAEEVALYLKSRQGLDVSAETVRNVVLGGLTADKVDESKSDKESSSSNNEVDEQSTMDLVELTAALIIPNLLRLRRKRIEQSRQEEYIERESSKCPSCRSGDSSNDTTDNNDKNRNDDGVGMEIFKDVLSLILADVTGSAEPKRINDKLVEDILLCYGEEHLARDKQLISEMVECASGPTVLLDVDAFVEGLTSDVERNYNEKREEDISTNFQDVFGRDLDGTRLRVDEEFATTTAGSDLVHENTLKETVMNQKCCQREKTNLDSGQIEESGTSTPPPAEYTRLFTAAAIDYASDNYRTRVHGVVVWIAFMAFYVAYLVFGTTTQFEANGCAQENKNFASEVACPFISGTVNALLVVTELILFGTPFVCLASVANGIDGRENAMQMIVGILLFLAFLFIPFYVRMEVPFWFSTKTNWNYQIISLLLGLVVTALQLFNLFMVLIRDHPRYKKWYTWYYSLGNIRYESKIKRAAMFKVDQMLSNALKLHSESLKFECNCDATKSKGIRSQKLSNYGRGLFEFSKLDGMMTEIGGMGYTWKRIWNGTLFTEDGIWISNRMALGTVFQIGVCCATPAIALFGIRFAIDFVAENQNAGEAALTPQMAGTITGLGATSGFCVAVYMTLCFMPTIVATTLKFRRGVIPSLRSREFLRYRFALDQVTLMYGGMLWGILVSAGAVAVIVGTIIFLLTWEQTSAFFLSLIGGYLGLGLVIVTKIIILQLLRHKFFAAFYRVNPLAANLVTLAMECYTAAIASYFMVVRGVKILLLGAMYIGRIDTSLFAEGVGMFGPIELDNWPTVTRKEILLHEAHRHPYLEQLGYLYLMQLRYKNGQFATRASSAWRLIFVSALMPWLHKFRELARPEDFGEADDESTHFRNAVRRSSIALGDMRGMLMGRSALMSRSSVGKRRALSTLAEDDESIEKHERIAEIKAEMENLQDELRKLEEDDPM